MLNVIFLDFDGVLNIPPYIGRDNFGHIFNNSCIHNLDTIIKKTGAKIVISSTWRMDGIEVMKEMWVKRNLPGEVIGCTPKTYVENITESGLILVHSTRGAEIQEYIDINDIENYCIIDDDSDMLPSQMDNFVKCNFKTGLTKSLADLAIDILNNV